MGDDRNLGKLHFINNEVDGEISVYWVLYSGNLEKKLWDVSVSFAKDWTVPAQASRLLYSALKNPAVRMVLELEDGRRFEGVIHDIGELSDSGVISVSAPELGRERFV